MAQNLFGAREVLMERADGKLYFYRLNKLNELGFNVDQLPFSIKVLLESVLREANNYDVTEDDVRNLAQWGTEGVDMNAEVPFKTARVILQDFTGVPAVVDLAAMRTAMVKLGGDPKKINPLIPVDLVIDHSVQVDEFGTEFALANNMAIEFERNRERYEFLRWGQQAFDNFGVVPPASGIVHQVNLEYLAKGVMTRPEDDGYVAYPDSLVGTDSHTTMINGLGIVGWGVGGIEAEAVMLGQPIYMLVPEVVGFKVTGTLPEGATATDLALRVTEILRANNVVGKFVEFYGPGLSNMTLPDRATIANMAPEYGATMGFFPVDDESLRYLRRTGRLETEIELVERYTKAQGLFRTDETPDPVFSSTIELDLSTVVPSLAGPKRPQDRVSLSDMKRVFKDALVAPVKNRGFELTEDELKSTGMVVNERGESEIGHGAVVLASITSCTNTSNPSVLIAAGLVAKKAVERGLQSKPHVKTSLAPGSRVVTEYLTEAGLQPYLDQIGFQTVGYGCMTCIGNSGPLPEEVVKPIVEANLVAASVLSGNRNFEGRINPYIKANYLASPPLVVVYALAGRVDMDLASEPLGVGSDGSPVYLRDIWPTNAEIQEIMDRAINAEMFKRVYDGIEQSNAAWNEIPVSGGELYEWNEDSTYIQNPPFFDNLGGEIQPITSIEGARVLVKVGDSVTTDHISPAGSFGANTPAGKFLLERGVQQRDFNSYGSRRGNDRIMTRGTFANIRLKNQLAPGTEGGFTTNYLSGEVTTIFEASEQYKAAGIPLVIIAGKDYGMGSSRDWAAKGTFLLGVKAVIAESFERIHRSNLVGMGVLPLQFAAGENADTLGLKGDETYVIELPENLKPRQNVTVRVTDSEGNARELTVKCRIDAPVEIDYYRNGGILQTVLMQLHKNERKVQA
ncbi:aconitate hydratase AcnA [Deinococcus peraridilitoris]|uniref:Aconitate hydratase n=1 Tax=Deinococcus peraridilitoris (strain DSM 19664 / LMG 22246 / CIP 109416 / KR-200) TaxID=937777 RepID=L0A5T4_DEIPD|nr:aconitate hydratase AcnA [Deinococcus peraridilitoris]AFZ68804.1 aconitate hydratase 1 [Deinococcus peraridilitoris DSM 19664]